MIETEGERGKDIRRGRDRERKGNVETQIEK